MNNSFQLNSYCVVKSAISDELRDFVTQYALFDEMQNYSPDYPHDQQFLNAHSKYADPAMETVLLHIQPIIEEQVGFSVYPTYSYYRVYRTGDVLLSHTDRPSCEVSATLCFNYDYENYQWPIYMGGKEVILEPGDLAIYKGCDIEHWRNKMDLPYESWHVQGFFHYVNANGPYSDYIYDKRETIGQKDKNSSIRKSKKRYIQYV